MRSSPFAAASGVKSPTATVNMAEFIGNTQGFAESGCVYSLFWVVCATYLFHRVSSAVVQRYLPQILDASLGGNVTVQNAAVDILGFTIRQGLAHPLQVCEPSLDSRFSLTPRRVPANHHRPGNIRECTIEQSCEWTAYNPTF